MHGHRYDLGDGYDRTNPLVIGTQITKVAVLQIDDGGGFRVLKNEGARSGCAIARDGLFDCGQGVSWRGCRSVVRVPCNFSQFNRIVGAARRLNAAIGVEY
jgi:hypothetical protein